MADRPVSVCLTRSAQGDVAHGRCYRRTGDSPRELFSDVRIEFRI